MESMRNNAKWNTKKSMIMKSALWKVRKCLSSRIIANTLSMIVAAIAAFISYKALDESVRQRESMYKPELFIGTVNFCADIRNVHDIKYYRIEKDSIFHKEELRPWYKLYNVGMGSALSIYGYMKFNSELLLSYFSENDLVDVITIKGTVIDTLVYKNDTLTIFNLGKVSDWRAEYVLPICQQKEESIQFFPPIVFDNIIKAFLWVIDEKHGEDTKDLKIPIELCYKDINDKWYKKPFEISIRCFLHENNKDIVNFIIYAGNSREDYLKEMGESLGFL